jgi:3-hydroxyacyl-[acyl-carrier-protein] dehydratase
MKNKGELCMLDVNQIMKILPHRNPFLMVDRILEIEIGTRIVGLKNVTINEPFFPGHFPGHPVMPGVLIIEAMAQVAAILAYQSDDSVRDKVTYFTGIDNAKFRKPVMPGDQLRFEIELAACKRGIWFFTAKALVDGKVVTEAELKATFAEKQS